MAFLSLSVWWSGCPILGAVSFEETVDYIMQYSLGHPWRTPKCACDPVVSTDGTSVVLWEGKRTTCLEAASGNQFWTFELYEDEGEVCCCAYMMSAKAPPVVCIGCTSGMTFFLSAASGAPLAVAQYQQCRVVALCCDIPSRECTLVVQHETGLITTIPIVPIALSPPLGRISLLGVADVPRVVGATSFMALVEHFKVAPCAHAIPLALVKPSPFDVLMANATYARSFLCGGDGDDINVFVAKRENPSVTASKLVAEVASKISGGAASLLRGWWNSKAPDPPRWALNPVSSEHLLSLCKGSGATLSGFSVDSFHRFAACCDSKNGRILILDAVSGAVFRHYKGYRNAQVAFVESAVGGSTKLFLLVYLDSRGAMELIDFQSGKRVCAHSVGQNFALIQDSQKKRTLLFNRSTFHLQEVTLFASTLSAQSSLSLPRDPHQGLVSFAARLEHCSAPQEFLRLAISIPLSWSLSEHVVPSYEAILKALDLRCPSILQDPIFFEHQGLTDFLPNPSQAKHFVALRRDLIASYCALSAPHDVKGPLANDLSSFVSSYKRVAANQTTLRELSTTVLNLLPLIHGPAEKTQPISIHEFLEIFWCGSQQIQFLRDECTRDRTVKLGALIFCHDDLDPNLRRLGITPEHAAEIFLCWLLENYGPADFSTVIGVSQLQRLCLSLTHETLVDVVSHCGSQAVWLASLCLLHVADKCASMQLANCASRALLFATILHELDSCAASSELHLAQFRTVGDHSLLVTLARTRKCDIGKLAAAFKAEPAVVEVLALSFDSTNVFSAEWIATTFQTVVPVFEMGTDQCIVVSLTMLVFLVNFHFNVLRKHLQVLAAEERPFSYHGAAEALVREYPQLAKSRDVRNFVIQAQSCVEALDSMMSNVDELSSVVSRYLAHDDAREFPLLSAEARAAASRLSTRRGELSGAHALLKLCAALGELNVKSTLKVPYAALIDVGGLDFFAELPLPQKVESRKRCEAFFDTFVSYLINESGLNDRSEDAAEAMGSALSLEPRDLCNVMFFKHLLIGGKDEEAKVHLGRTISRSLTTPIILIVLWERTALLLQKLSDVEHQSRESKKERTYASLTTMVLFSLMDGTVEQWVKARPSSTFDCKWPTSASGTGVSVRELVSLNKELAHCAAEDSGSMECVADCKVARALPGFFSALEKKL